MVEKGAGRINQGLMSESKNKIIHLIEGVVCDLFNESSFNV